MAIGAPQLQQRDPAVDKDGRFTNVTLQVINDGFAQIYEILDQLAAISGVDLPGLAAAAQAAQDAADNANTAANNAQNATDAAKLASDLATSYVDDPALITATDAGASVTISIAAHNRIYGDGTSVAVSAGSLPGLAYNTAYYVFYDDPTRAGGSVTYQSSINPQDAAQLGDRHSVGFAPPLAPAAAPATGGGTAPPGGGYYFEP